MSSWGREDGLSGLQGDFEEKADTWVMNINKAAMSVSLELTAVFLSYVPHTIMSGIRLPLRHDPQYIRPTYVKFR